LSIYKKTTFTINQKNNSSAVMENGSNEFAYPPSHINPSAINHFQTNDVLENNPEIKVSILSSKQIILLYTSNGPYLNGTLYCSKLPETKNAKKGFLTLIYREIKLTLSVKLKILVASYFLPF
jgi:hypothetical protein